MDLFLALIECESWRWKIEAYLLVAQSGVGKKRKEGTEDF